MDVTKVWKLARDFQKGNIIVRVTQLDQDRPRYSFQLLRKGHDGKELKHFGIFLDFNGTPTLKQSIANEVALLIAEAEGWVESEVRRQEDIAMSNPSQVSL